MDLDTVKTAISYRLGDPTRQRWGASEIAAYVQEGYDDLLEQTRILWGQAPLAQVAGTAIYDVDSLDILHVDRVTNKDMKLEVADRNFLEAQDRDFESQQGDIYAYTMEAEGLSNLRLIRVPSVTSATDTVVEGYMRGEDLSSCTDFGIPDIYVRYIVWFVMARCLDREGPGQDTVYSKHFRDRYDAGIARVKRRLTRNYGRRVGVMGDPTTLRGFPPRPSMPWNFPRR